MAAPARPCAGCELPVPEGEEGAVWLETPLGLTAVHTHRVQGCAQLAVEHFPEQPARRVRRPETKEEKALRRAASG